MTMRWRDKILVAKIESTYGVDPVPTGGDAILALEVALTPMEGQDKSRDLDRGYLGGQPTIPLDLHTKLSFKVEIAGSGASGTAPGWGALMRACAFAETVTASTSVVYNPISDGHESITIYLWIGSTRYAVTGARGNVTLRFNASDLPYLEFEFTGLFTMPSEVVRITPDYTAFKKPEAVTNANTPEFSIDGTDFVLRNLSLAAGNDVQSRFLIGAERVIIVDRSETVEFQVEATPLTTFNPFQLAKDQTAVDLQLVHGMGSGNVVTLDVPTMQMQRPTGLTEAQGIKEWPLRGIPLPASGNDQFTLTLT
ncbi:hypothetical protein JQX09_22425 [Sulfitobacter pseudonitzschiae]|uniref:Uncharacterized protein n=1 Tax=Pseudosulfitobacter pseudonitzschiae TaxID=1402135 RepID=A0A9Q2NY36_9RHOB|nr:phage tail tube protein [Pseudosulfitobacter pseudonitzschiae]MBM2294707.1 hypothetical protein [Pseudosulfitobacter pseudonitzschiae]MBM2299644.1 hypothetical protein [Pseudosulfitobacter pseudonitzschiae]MBM2304519.1 hypothetical protein [Pseudosulfitobacter pseudonitzschiae]MBM2314318.1 hypothetical protein [Pseudosulfitobacter pseudonitzschiae]MBM2319210.1 hypothetical protein [Pseudosulfitobacter pseudonitzschiae]